MSQMRTLDVSGIPAYHVSNQALLFWGQVLMCVIEGMLFVILIATYFYLRLGVDAWPPPGVELGGVMWPTLTLIPLLASCIGSYMASEAVKRSDRRGMLIGMGLNLALAFVFVAMRTIEWRRFNFTWRSDVHGSIVWTIFFLHTYDIVADMIVTAVLILIVALGRCGPRQRLGVHVDSVLWYFLVGSWIPLYGLVYWAPRWIGGAR